MAAKLKHGKVSDFTPDPANANRGTERGLRLLDDSLRESGAGRSLLADMNGVLIAGNKTAERAVDVGLDDAIIVQTDGSQVVIVQRTDLDINTPEGRAMAYRDNRVGELDLAWSPEQLLADLNAQALPAGLFNDDELAAILSGLLREDPPGDPGAQLDRAEQLRETWQTERGQVWQVGRHRVMCGDSTDKADVALLMGDDRAELVVTDPPYGVSYASKNEYLNAVAPANRIQTPIENDHASKEDTQALWKAAFAQMAEVMSAGAVVYCFMPQGGDQMMMMMMMMGAGIEPRHELIWLKNNHVLGRTDYAYKHEPILYAWKSGGHKFYGDFQTSVLEFDRPQSSDLHPTMKPVELLEQLITNSSIRGGVVYDPFIGSGSTLVACERQGRKGMGMELSPAYTAVVCQRLADMGLEPRLIDHFE